MSRIKAALAGIADAELRGLAEATNDVEQVAPGLLAWLEAACDWELNRRQGLDYEMQPPEAAVPPEEDDISVGAANRDPRYVRTGLARRARAVRCASPAAGRRQAETLGAHPLASIRGERWAGRIDSRVRWLLSYPLLPVRRGRSGQSRASLNGQDR